MLTTKALPNKQSHKKTPLNFDTLTFFKTYIFFHLKKISYWKKTKKAIFSTKKHFIKKRKKLSIKKKPYQSAADRFVSFSRVSDQSWRVAMVTFSQTRLEVILTDQRKYRYFSVQI